MAKKHEPTSSSPSRRGGGDIARKMTVEQWPLDRLVLYAKNARTHSPEQVDQIAASIKEFGWTNPILAAEDGTIIAGHGRYQAARRLELETAPVIVLDDLTDTQRRALVIADNRIALNSGWDEEMLSLELRDLSDADFAMSLLGFGDEELGKLLNGDANHGQDEEGPEQFPEYDESIETEHQCPKCGYKWSGKSSGLEG